ncbi:MAG: hypothetical protein HC876_21605 [Chloroflexaceae bacterium]|nr:hypothetical protein [Chloroflexaceae bacterium]
MTHHVALTVTHHDPQQRLDQQAIRCLPILLELYSHINIVVTPQTAMTPWLQHRRVTLDLLAQDTRAGMATLGQVRRRALAGALRIAPQASHLHLCDFDRILHWVETYPDELRQVIATITDYDMTILGRTARAFASHPRTQRETEAMINHVFTLASGLPWDVTAASRGLSRPGATYLLEHCPDDTVGVDCSWVLCMQRAANLRLHALHTEGLEFETLDRFADEVAELGGPEAWIARVDADPRQWALRSEIAYLEIQSIAAYTSV